MPKGITFGLQPDIWSPAIMSDYQHANVQIPPVRSRIRPCQLLRLSGLGWLMLSIAGCGTTLRPLIISTELVQGSYGSPKPSPTTNAPKTPDALSENSRIYGDLPNSIHRVNALRVRYLEGVVDDAQLKNLLGLGLIAASAYGIYKGISSSGDGTQRMLARLGIGAGAMYAYGENFISEPRQRTYLAGSDALGCAVLASTPYLYTRDEFGIEGDATKDTNLQGILAVTNKNLAILENEAATVGQRWLAKAVINPICKSAPASVPAGISPEDAASLAKRSAASASQQKRACQNGTSSQWAKVATAATANVDSARKEAERAVAAARQSINDGNALVARIKNASAQLEARASEIQNQVAIEVTKTQPNLAAIFQGGESLRLNAATFSGSFKPSPATPAPKAESRVNGDKAADAENRALFNEAQRDMATLGKLQSALSISKASLDGWVARSNERAKQVGNLSACKFDGSKSGSLELTPDVVDIQLAPNGSFTWFVHGVTGRPQAYGVGMNIDNLRQSVVGQSVTLTLTKTLPDGQSALWMITDSNGGAHREVRISNSGVGNSLSNGSSANGTDALSAEQLIQICKRFVSSSINDASCMESPQMKVAKQACENTLKKMGLLPSQIEVQKAMLEGGQCPLPQ